MKTLVRYELELKLLAAFVLLGVIIGTCCRAQGAELHPTFRAMVDATNTERQARGHAPLVVDQECQAMAERWGAYMARSGSFRHSGFNGGENIAMGQQSIKEVMGDWMNSRGHRANILGRYTRVGCAAYKFNDTCCWIQTFR